MSGDKQRKRATRRQNTREWAAVRALARSRAFGLLARALHYPDEELFAALHSGRWARDLAEAARQSGLSRMAPFLAELRRVPESVPDELEAMRHSHSAIYSSGSVCPQQENDYVAGHAFQKTDVMADVAGFYRAFGLRVSRTQRELPDFLGSELEFLHAAAWKEARALQDGNDEAADVCRRAEKKFLAEHLGVWIGSFRMRMERSPAHRFYVVLARLAEGFVEAQGVKPRFAPAPETSEAEMQEPATCTACK